MSNQSVVVLSSVLAAAVAGAVVFFVRPEPAAPPTTERGEAALLAQLDAIGARLDRLEQRLAARDQAAPVRTATDTPTRADVEVWVAEALAARGASPAGEAEGEFRIDAAVAELVDVGVNGGEESQAIWERARAAGKVKDLIAAFEARAQENPGSADAQADLGDAYVQGIVGAGDLMSQSVYGQKADVAYGAALALDETHWRARFSKATGLTFWPDFLGKKAEAIEHFEILAGQQEGTPRRPEYRLTWVTLGNLYQQQGKDDLARQTWERGLRQFPDDAELRQKLGR